MASVSISLAALRGRVNTLIQNSIAFTLWVHIPMCLCINTLKQTMIEMIVTIVPYDSFYPFWVLGLYQVDTVKLAFDIAIEMN